MASEQAPQNQVNELVTQISQFEAQGEYLEKQYEALNAYFTEMTMTLAALEELEKSQEGAEVLVPIGSSSWVRAVVTDVKEVIVCLGADVSAAKSVPEARETIQNRIQETQNAVTQTGEQLEQVKMLIENMRAQLQQFVNQAQT